MMRTRGHLGKAVYHMTRQEKSDLFGMLDRIEQGIATATGKLAQPQSYQELEDVVMVSGIKADNVTVFPAPAQVVQLTTPATDTVVAIRPDVRVTAPIQQSAPMKAFPQNFYDYFEFVDAEKRKAI